MSGRRQRAKTARAIASEEQQYSSRRKSIQKPKYVEDANRGSETPTSARSRVSTPNSSRHPSRSPSPPLTSGRGRRRSSINSLAFRNSARGKRGGLNSSGSNTPIGRGSRSSSVASAARNRRSSAVTPKIKMKLGRGYNPSLVNYKESEYHYGSDFDDDEDEGNEEHDSESSSDEDDEDADSDDLKVESDVELDLDSESIPADSGSSTPIPFWLRTGDEVPPPLVLPPSSEDLLITPDVLLKACSTYEVLRHYRMLLRLSPFRFEDFCASLAAEEQSNLLSEIHIALLKTIMRAEEKDNTTFAPMDQKDSVNCMFFFLDSLTWPEGLKSYLSSDPDLYAEPLQILSEHKEYPMTSPAANWVQCRVDMLSFLADQFLMTNAVREDIATEGAPTLEDHCRVCHRLGDMLVCEQCSGVFHLACLDPQLQDVPDEDWQCYVCQADEVVGVTDCDNDNERSMNRHEALGFDRAGNKYWFVCRRLFVEAQDGTVSYYTSVKQLEEVLQALDEDLFEADLCETLEYLRPEIERQMTITETLTNEKKASFRKSYLELENETIPVAIEKLQEERTQHKRVEAEKRRQEAEEKRKAMEEATKKIKEDEEHKIKSKLVEEETKKKLREERLRKREESRGDAFQESSELLSDFDDSDLKDDSLMDVDETPEVEMPVAEGETQVKTEAVEGEEVEVKEETLDESVKMEMTENEIEIKEENIPEKTENDSSTTKANTASTTATSATETTSSALTTTTATPTSKPIRCDVDNVTPDLRLTRKTTQQINTGTLFFKLGQEASYKTYVNQFSTNASALSKVQATEERVKRTHLSHKFSLTDASIFKWVGSLHGTRAQVLTMIRATLLQLEGSIPTIFMHSNWGMLRKPWTGAVGNSVTPRDFARALTVLQCCLKPCLMLNVWYESLGHTQLKKFTAQLKEDKKKVDKRERREKEEEEEKLRPYIGFVKYTLGLKHQVAKQRGEEYRVHGQNGWLWLSSTRNFCPSNMMKLGLRAGPHRLAVKYTDIRDKSFKIVLMEPKAFEYLIKRQDEIDLRKAMGLTEEEIAEAEESEHKGEDDAKTKERLKLETALKSARLARQVPDDSAFADVVDVEDGIGKNTRCIYPKVAAKTKYLNDFLQRRLQLKTIEERQLELHSKTSIDGKFDALSRFVDDAKKSLWSTIAKLKEAQVVTITAPTTAAPAEVEATPPKRPSDMLCYSTQCRTSSTSYPCYSVTCQKNKIPSASAAPSVVISNPAVQEAINLYSSLIKNAAANHGLVIPAVNEFSNRETAMTELQNFVKILMQKKEEAQSKVVVNGDASSSDDKKDATAEVKKQPEKRIYSTSDTTGRLYLKKIQSIGEHKAKSKEIKYPLAPSFHSKSRNKKNILILAKYDVKRLARKAGIVTCEGFNYTAKANNQVWPYPCPRPTFKTAWLFRTACLESLQTVGLQLRILWACLKWDDMQSKPPTADGKHQVTTDSAIMTTEILKTRTTGRFLERTEYLQRKITIPLDVPKTIKEVAPIRSGLRKRKRAESPLTEPKVTEEWIEEEKLELWEIRGFKEKQDRDKAMSLTRSRTGTVTKEPLRLDPGGIDAKNRKPEQIDVKSKMEEQLRLQREALQKKPVGIIRTAINTTPAPSPTIIRRIQNPDGTVSLVRTISRPLGAVGTPTGTTPTTPLTTGGPTAPKRIFVTKDGKILSEQVLSGVPTAVQPQAALQQLKTVTPITPAPTTPVTPATLGSQQKVQIVRSTDGKIQVRGLLPGQQLVQTPEGKLQIVTQALKASPAATPISLNAQTQVVTNSVSPALQPQNKLVIASPSQVVTPGGQIKQQISPATPNQQIIGSPVKMVQTSNAILNPGTNQIVATQLAPGSQIPPGTTVFVSGGKTYCIPKASATLAGTAAQTQPATPVANTAQLQPSNLTPSAPQMTLTPNVVTATTTTPTATVQQHPQQQPKQMVEVKTLGQNVVSFKGNQMIVQGPDIAQAQLIAKQLASGSSRLAMLNGKQVLISTTPTIIPQQPQQVVQQPQQIVQQQQLQQVIQQPQQIQQVVQPQQVVQQPQQIVQQVMTSPQSIQSSPVQSTLPQQILQSPPLSNKEMMEGVKLPTEPLPQPQLAAEPEQPSQPAVTSAPQSPIKQPMQITAQLVQTQQGPRIILQGIQGASLPKEYLLKIQQQVKTQLLKAQAEAKQQNRVPPTKIAIQLHPSIQAELEKDQSKVTPSTPTEPSSQIEPTLPVQQTAPQPQLPMQPITTAAPQPQIVLPTQPLLSPRMTSPTAAPPMQVMNVIRNPRPIAPQTSTASPRPVVLQQIVNTSQGQRFVLIGPSGTKMAMIASSASPLTSANSKIVSSQPLNVILPNAPNPQTTIFSNASNTATTTVTSSQVLASMNIITSANSSGEGDNDKFELTQDYIQKAISDALKSQNLSPEIEQKLLAMQNYTNERTFNPTPVAPKRPPAPIDPLSGEPMDDEWEPTSRPRSSAGGRKRKPATVTSAASPAPEFVENSTPVMSPVNTTSNSVISMPRTVMTSPPPVSHQVVPVSVAPTPKAPATPPRVRTKSGQRSGSGQPSQTVAAVSSPVVDEKRRQHAMNKLSSMLVKHKEQLKKDIARKRALQEKEIQIVIHREIEKAKVDNQVSSASNAGPVQQNTSNNYNSVASSNDVIQSGKRKRRESHNHQPSLAGEANTSANSSVSPPAKKKKRTSTSSTSANSTAALMMKKNAVYCVCKKKYDPTKFYVGCDVCNNWFHGHCIGISESSAKNLSEYVCDECTKAKEKQEIYCLCKQPYDESQFYIGCERCSDWFHGHCVGILQVEADNIDEYLCPRCDPNSAMNRPNMKALRPKDYELVDKIVKQLMINRNSSPFKVPVNPSDVPNYYKVVKVPMDLQTIEERVTERKYTKLSEFVGDVMRIFENCRFFNQPNSQITKSAVALESFFSQKLALLREKIAEP